MGKEIKVFRVLANPRRFQIVEILLSKDKANVTAIAKKIKLSFKSTSKHLCLLENTGLIARKQEGLCAFYNIKDDLKSPLRKLLQETADLDI